MLEAGIVRLVMADPNVQKLCAREGGFAATLPKDKPLPSWTYRTISETGDPTLQGNWGFVTCRLQIDVMANTAGEAQLLGRAIDWILNCYVGILPDEDHTQVYDCFRSDLMDVSLDPTTRRYTRILEYEINFFDARRFATDYSNPAAQYGRAVYGTVYPPCSAATNKRPVR